MPIVPSKKATKKELAVFLLPSWLQLQTNPTGSIESIKVGLKELERALGAT
ncbi:hypothetical protein LCGC14_0532210 [marine sediment metagenome]|uniref:Uncharacterized protein n=1 Tax=marine sediment metagenome TaxID=412755 RepID=A0A0F9SDM3_9ZZZZ